MRQDERKARQELLAHMAATIASGYVAGYSNSPWARPNSDDVATYSVLLAKMIMDRANPPEKE